MELLTDHEVAARLRRSRSALQKDRVAGIGIPFIRLGRLVRYREGDVDRFLADLPTCRSTRDAAEPRGDESTEAARSSG